MKIVVINPTTTAGFNEFLGEQARRYARPDTEIEVGQIGWGPASIEGHYEEELAALAILELIAERRNDADGFVIACYGDPGLYAARELSPVPVGGIGEASMLMACTVAHRFSIVTILDRFKPAVHDMVRRYGLQDRCASVRSTGFAVLDCERDPDGACDRVAEQARQAIEHDGAEAILLGCGGFSRLDKRLQEELGVPVIDGVSAAVGMLEAGHAYGISTSRVAAFMAPEAKDVSVPAGALGAFQSSAVAAAR
jgi:allantoin racemase